MGLFFNEDINTLFVGSNAVKAVYMGDTLVWPTGLPVGTVFNFEYTGSVQSVELPPGKYKLQCWGAQGGTSYGSSSGTGSKGGYSEGVLTLTKTTTLYIFVGGQGSRGSSTSLVNGGWNGGGASVGYSSYNSGDTNGYSYPACGGGATDISTVTSSMSYSGGRTNRSSASLLARCIVAGGGAGGSYRYTIVTTTTNNTITNTFGTYSDRLHYYTVSDVEWCYFGVTLTGLTVGRTYSVSNISVGVSPRKYRFEVYKSDGSVISSNTITMQSNYSSVYVRLRYYVSDVEGHETCSFDVIETYTDSNTSTSTSSGYSNKSQQGGGTSGRGQYPGTQSSAGTGGGFGYGANQESTNYHYCAGAGGGGWYGGGTNKSDSSTSYVNYSGGGSGFVNTASNASYRPSGYTGLQLDSGTTTAGNNSHPSTSGGTETGHSGNGYAKITILSQ